MAEAFLHVAVQTLTSLIKDEVGLILGVDKEMKKMASNFTAIQAVLEDAQFNHLESREIKDWLGKLNDVACDIDDILDECATHVAKAKHLPGRYFWKNILDKRDIGRKIKEATKRLEEIAAERAKFHLRETYFEKPTNMLADSKLGRETGSILNEPEYIFGRDGDKQKIVDIVVNQVKGNERISVLPILGIGGLGKTTLAQLLFRDPHVGEHFDTKLWVSVNNNFDIKVLIKKMIESGETASPDLENLDALQRRLGGLLNQKRYLLVLDDVWSDDQEKWCQLRNLLACGATGSSIIVTTRLRKVAEIVRTLPIYELKGLLEEHCWTLFKHSAFPSDEQELYPNLEAIGKQIINKCAGVPLAAKALGGILRFKRREREWISVKESEMWELPEEENKMLPVLKLSYHHLPLELRQCFAYCGVLHKNFKISKDELIYLWMAHGYISSNGKLEVEEVGEQIFDELSARSLLQIKKYSTSKNVYLTMHDLIHDLAQSVMKSKVLVEEFENLSTSASNSKIREAHLQGSYSAISRGIAKKYSRTRVLHLCYLEINVLPSTLGSLNHLRFLNLLGSKIQNLPDSICNIWNLRILILDNCHNLVALPKKMRYLKNLRILLIDYCESLHKMPKMIRELTSLRRLSRFIVGHDKGYQLDELECLNLSGKLQIEHLERVTNPGDAKKANLVEKENLHELLLSWSPDTDTANSRERKDEKILEALQPPPNVENLTIRNYNGRHFPNWMGSLEKLNKISLGCCKHLSDCFHLKELPHLKLLSLWDVGVEYIVRGGNGVDTCFPVVEEIRLDNLKNLKGFSSKNEDSQDMCPMLKKLYIKGCPSLILPPLNNLEDLSCDESMNLASLPMFDNLKTLFASIGNECIPTERFPNLNELYIFGAHQQCLAADWMYGLNSLPVLKICSRSLTCLPKGWLCHNSTRIELDISFCDEFVDIPKEIKHLQSLKQLCLNYLSKMICIPDAFKHLSWLKELNLEGLNQLTSLPDWLGDLTSLTILGIWDCENLASLPDSIQEMTNLQALFISSCPDLKTRHEKGKGRRLAQDIPHSQRFDTKRERDD